MEIEKIKNLIKIAKNSSSKHKRNHARKKLLKNQTSLIKFTLENVFSNPVIFSTDYFHTLTDIIGYINDEKVLMDIAVGAQWKAHRHAAIKNPHLKHEESLKKVALKKESSDFDEVNHNKKETSYNISTAIEKINNQEILEEIVLVADKHNEVNTLIKALCKIKNEEILRKYALNHRILEVRKASVGQLNNQEILEEIFHSHNFASVHKAALKKIKNQTLLIKIATSKEYADDRTKREYLRIAIENITEESSLLYIAQSTKNDTLRSTAIKNPNLTDEEILIDFAKYDKSQKVRLAAIEKITRQDVLTDIIIHDESLESDVILKINNKNVLKELMENEDGKDSIWRKSRREYAALRLNDINKLSKFRQLKLLEEN